MSFCACLVMACLCGYGSSAFPVYCGTGVVVCNNRPHTSSMCAFWLVIWREILANLAILSSFAEVKAAILQDYYAHAQWCVPTDSPITEKFAVCQNFVPPNLPAIQSLSPHMHTYWEGIALQSIRFWWAGQVWGMCLYAQGKFPVGIDTRR